MRKRISYRVCRCLPTGVVTHLEARVLKELVNREIHPIRCAQSCKQKYQRAMYVGDLCAETGHFWWARKVWLLAARLIENKDFDDWVRVDFGDGKRMKLEDVISETECELLMRRCSDLWLRLGFPEYAWWDERQEYLSSRYFGTCYGSLYLEKYSGCIDETIGEWDDFLLAVQAEEDTERLFRDGQGELPPSAQDFYEFWGE